MKHTLYIERPLIDAERLSAYAEAIGIPDIVPSSEMHVTVALSTDAVEWAAPAFQTLSNTVEVGSGGREFARFGDAVVLLIQSRELSQRWASLVLSGASWDHDSYRPHITVSYNKDVSVEALPAYTRQILLGPENRQEVDDGWYRKVKET